ncbi:MAG: HEAT repeat domain-containing protein [Planctomycetaceae bacterium]
MKIFSFRPWCAAVVAILACPAVGVAADTAAALRDEAALVAVLRSDAPEADKAMACKELAVRGSGAAVPALAPLLADEHLASWARIAIEAIPDPASDAALRDAVRGGGLAGRLLVGAINSIGVRRDPAAVDTLVKRLGDADAAVAAAAAVALGRIGDAAATAALRTALAEGPAGVRPAVAEGFGLCAERLLADGKAADAAALCDLVRAADVPAPRIIEATRGAILARGDAGVPLLLEQLRSPDRRRMNIGLSVARELRGAAADEALAREFAAAREPLAVLLAEVLADRGGPRARDALVAAVAAPATPAAVRLVAVRCLGRVGDASSVAPLLALLGGGDAVGAAARVALGEIRGADVDAAIVRRLNEVKGPALASLFKVIGRRRIALPLQKIEKLVMDDDEAVSLAALEALGATADLEGLKVLVSEVLAPRGPTRAAAALAALRAAAVRMPDREACADVLARSLTAGDDVSRVAVLDILGEMGGPRALAAVAAAAGGSDPALQDAGTRLLGTWMTPDAAEQLVTLAKSLPDGKFRTRAFRGYLRVARQLVKDEAGRLAMCREALGLARGADDRRQVLEALRLVPTADGLRLAADAATDDLRDDARATAAAILQKMGQPSPEAWDLAGKLGLQQAKVEIVQATYGSKDKQKDVTEMVRKRVAGVPVIALGAPAYNASFGGDPAPGEPKKLVIRYTLDGRAGEATFAEDAPIILPVPSARQ